ncbi:hypothetical protein [Lederbergia lenta]|uniref:Uncharacterized protein n=2 Tax=Lederbergia lenta TaxID=1467 RepID=A0A2X4VXK1_LEDLE|nr:hypothetical protein [Lederbergia lenta]SQI52608.1 Uncharacterised protein [Lederbergia lenta]
MNKYKRNSMIVIIASLSLFSIISLITGNWFIFLASIPASLLGGMTSLYPTKLQWKNSSTKI